MSATKAELGSTEPKSSKSVFRNQDLNAALNMAKLACKWLNEKKKEGSSILQRDQTSFTNNNGEQGYNCGSASQRLSQVLFGKSLPG
jgi:hypothetical protein